MDKKKKPKIKRWKYQIDLGPLSLLLSGIFILFFLSWIFILGIFVGRGILPGKINLPELESKINILGESNVTDNDEDVLPLDSISTEPELVFYDRLTTKKDEAKNSGKTKSVAKTNQTDSGPIRSVDDETYQRDNKDLKIPGDATAGAVSGQYTVQVASIENRTNAEKTVKELIEKGLDAYYYETVVNGKRYYRIRCGKFSERTEALQYSLKVEEKTGLKGYVTGIE